jgi:hypothetical protein
MVATAPDLTLDSARLPNFADATAGERFRSLRREVEL